ncbi:MAG: hypothetical protein WDZ30_01180 [Cellvibrionaceae bacterium]
MISPFHPLQLALGPAIWLAWFSAMYGGLSLACVAAPPAPEQGAYTWINGVLLAATLVTTGLLVYWTRNCWRAPLTGDGIERPARAMISRVAAGLYLVSAVATLSVGLTVLVLPPCV